MQSVNIGRRASGSILGAGSHVQRSRHRIDHRRAGNPKRRCDGGAISLPRRSLRAKNRGSHSGPINKTDSPHRSRRDAAGGAVKLAVQLEQQASHRLWRAALN
jgi:hypothetical protein